MKALGVKVPTTLLASTDEVVDSTLFPAVRKSGFGPKADMSGLLLLRCTVLSWLA